MSIITSSKLITLNSLHASRRNGSFLSDVFFPFNGVYLKSDDIISVQLAVQSAQIVCSFYAINYTNNELEYMFNSVPYVLTVTPGNYNANTFMTELIHQFFLNGHVFSVSVDRQTSRLLFYSTSASYTFYDTSTIAHVLGLGDSSISSSLSTISCPVAMNLLGVTKIQMSSQLLQVPGFDSNSGCGSTSVLASIPVDKGSFGLLTYNPTPVLGDLNESYVNGIDIQLMDQNGALINFNGIHWSATLVLVTSRLFTPIPKLVVGLTQPDESEEPEQEQEQDATDAVPDADVTDEPEPDVTSNNEPDIVSDNTLDGMF